MAKITKSNLDFIVTELNKMLDVLDEVKNDQKYFVQFNGAFLICMQAALVFLRDSFRYLRCFIK